MTNRLKPTSFLCLPVWEGESIQGWLLLLFHSGYGTLPCTGVVVWGSVLHAWPRECPLHRHPSIHLQGSPYYCLS